MRLSRGANSVPASQPSSSIGDLKVYVSLANETFSVGTPAAANRSITLLSIPHVIGLTKPSGGGGE